LTKLAIQNDTPLPADTFPFQYYPESYTDSQEANFITKEVPGGSLPLYQWVNSGARTITFQAYFSCDVDLFSQGDSNQFTLYQLVRDAGLERRNVDIRTVMAHLRTFRLPTYGGPADTGALITYAPTKALLTIPRSGIGLIGGVFEGESPLPDSIVCVMTQCDFTIQAMFPSGLPRLVTADLQFAQVPQVGGEVQFPSAPQSPLLGSSGTLPYPLEPRKGKGG